MAGRFSVEGILKLTDRMTRPIVKIDKRLARFVRRGQANLNKLDKAFGKVHGGIKRVAAGVAVAGVAMGLALKNIAGSGADFEEAITAVGAVGLKTRAEIKPLEDMALRLGRTTKFTATEAANAMETMARAGFSNQDILSGVGGVLSAAAASGLEMEEVANHVSNALKGFQLEASQATRVSDVLALASSKTNSSIGSLGESLSNVASTARELGVPLEDTVAAVASLQDVGLDASVAGSALNTMLTKLAKPPAAIAKQMKKFGLSFKDAKGNMLPFGQVISNINEAAKRSGGSLDRVGFLADLVGLRGQKAASNLATLFEKGKLQDLTKELYKAEGAAEKMAALKMDNLKGDMTLLESAVDGVKQALFKTEGGPLRGIVQGMTDWVTANTDLMVSGFSGWMSKIKENAWGIEKAVKAVGSALAIFYAYAAAVKIATIATSLLTQALLLSPIGAIALAVAALGVLLYTFWPEISAGAKKAWDAVSKMAVAAWEVVTASVKSAWDAVTQFTAGAWNGIKSFFVGVGEFVVGVFERVFPGITDSTRKAIGRIKTAWSEFSAWLGWLWSGVVDIASDVASSIMNVFGSITGFFASIWSDVSTLASDAASSIMDAFAPISGFFASLWNGMVEGFLSAFSWIFDTIGSFIGDTRSIGRNALQGGSSEGDSSGTPASNAQTISPQERAANSTTSYFESTKNFSSSEVVIRDESGKASMPRPPKKGSGIFFKPSGAI